ncbi:MAG: enoyl-CoA hydratase/isomerase family protein [Leucobacter sp.]|jgi:2-(1,2-epoxy-1,2-dihydrophenyl)acetyl-CoA isomerase|nr:enoyl-CoA hydratase/isomerase family protein [Leucobacter sp.]
MSQHIHYDVSEGIATITIDRPEKRNALSYEMYDAIRDHAMEADADPSIGAIILTAVPGQFCAGTDLTELRDVAPGTKPEDREGHTDGRHWFFWECNTPVIAAVDGPAAGLGVELLTQCDLRIASTQARFSWIFVQRGLIPDTGAGTWLLPQIVGAQQAKRLVFSGEFIDAVEARDIGFLLDVVEPEQLQQAARELAKRVSTGSPYAIARAKSLLNWASSRGRDEHLHEHIKAMTECQTSEDHKEGVAAFLERRPARFTGR